MKDEFAEAEMQSGETSIFVRWGGAGPPILLLHGFPQTHLMWRRVAPLLARRFTVVCADLRAMDKAAVRLLHPITSRTRSVRWRGTWSL